MARADIDTKTIEKLTAQCTSRFRHPNAFPDGAWVEQQDCTLFRAKGHDGNYKFFMESRPGDLSIDWLDVTDYMQHFNVHTFGNAADQR